MSGYIYIRENELCQSKNIVKLGITSTSPKDREYGYTTYEHKRGVYLAIFQIELKYLKCVDNLLKIEFRQYNNYINCGTEYYSPIILEKIEPYLKSIPIEYIVIDANNMNSIIKEEEFQKKVKILKQKGILQKLNTHLLQKIQNKKIDWSPRDYQIAAIEYGYHLLLRDKKFYLELPTGGGKSFITFNLLKNILRDGTELDLILIISPRKIVNSQNVSEKYINILGNNKCNVYKCNVYNYSDGNARKFNEFAKKGEKGEIKILIVCTSSVDKIYDKIKDLNICIWFDEAHYGIESWLEAKKETKKSTFYLKNNTNIKYRIFSSASPDRGIIQKNKDIFGELYNPIKISSLIKLNWLCPIVPYVYMENKINVNKIKFMLQEFTDKNRKFGFSFHNAQVNAFELFYFHYCEYILEKTTIKPFLLIGDNFFSESDIKELSKIELDYDYKDIKVFELHKSCGSLGYVVAKYSMGYDFKLLDFIAFNDPKLSFKDIIQCIGRGIRPDCLGRHGTNLNKYLMILLPIYFEDAAIKDNKFYNIKKVLQYLLNDIELTIEDFWFIDKIKRTRAEAEAKAEFEYYKYDERYKNLGTESVLTTVLNLLGEKKEKSHDFTNSTIMSSKVFHLGVEYKPSRLKYKTILTIIYKLINDRDQIMKNTVVNIIKNIKTDNGFNYIEELQMSVQGVDSNRCVTEIITQCKKNNISVEIDIKLKNNDVVNIVV